MRFCLKKSMTQWILFKKLTLIISIIGSKCKVRDSLGVVVKNMSANAGDTGSVSGLGRSHMRQSN